jgi:hypothetical protein
MTVKTTFLSIGLVGFQATQGVGRQHSATPGHTFNLPLAGEQPEKI